MQKQLFGTNGVRGVVGKEITPELALRIGEALGTMRPGSHRSGSGYPDHPARHWPMLSRQGFLLQGVRLSIAEYSRHRPSSIS